MLIKKLEYSVGDRLYKTLLFLSVIRIMEGLKKYLLSDFFVGFV